MKQVEINEPFTNSLVQKINELSKTTNSLIIILKNTKGVNPELLKYLNNNVTISVIGGLNPQKQKFNNNYYQERTYYSPKELASIIQIFESMERSINPTWNELEKAMFIYKKICEFSTYSNNSFNGRDAARNLLGLITGQSVCAGYAMIFKEAMDRLGIPCEYQNKQSHHGWNIIKINGEYHAIELTWDVCNKKNNTCNFYYFCREDEDMFYNNEHHDISDESEEKRYPLKKISTEILNSTFQKITSPKVLKHPTNIEDGLEKITILGNEIVIVNGVPKLNNVLNDFNTYTRDNSSTFLIFPTGKKINAVYEYVYLVYDKMNSIKAAKIYSEMNLVQSDENIRKNIANNLLSEDRIQTKINCFNGYVGYVEGTNLNRYYNTNFEENTLNIYR